MKDTTHCPETALMKRTAEMMENTDSLDWSNSDSEHESKRPRSPAICFDLHCNEEWDEIDNSEPASDDNASVCSMEGGDDYFKEFSDEEEYWSDSCYTKDHMFSDTASWEDRLRGVCGKELAQRSVKPLVDSVEQYLVKERTTMGAASCVPIDCIASRMLEEIEAKFGADELVVQSFAHWPMCAVLRKHLSNVQETEPTVAALYARVLSVHAEARKLGGCTIPVRKELCVTSEEALDNFDKHGLSTRCILLVERSTRDPLAFNRELLIGHVLDCMNPDNTVFRRTKLRSAFSFRCMGEPENSSILVPLRMVRAIFCVL